MKIINTIDEVVDVDTEKAFVPTMGALHEGHISLVNRAKEFNVPIWMSIFVNKLQFNDSKDFNIYPRDIEKDIYIAESAGVDVLFIPDHEYVYRNYTGIKQDISLSAGKIGKQLEGKSRPGHFDGILKVMDSFLNDVQPKYTLLGRKDAQQFFIVSTKLQKKHEGVQFVACPIVREENGLALSSRNSLLSTQGKEDARCFSHTLSKIADEKNLITFFNQSVLEEKFYSQGFKGVNLDYIRFVDASSFDSPIQSDLEYSNLFETTKEFYILIAGEVEGVRLIDNMFIYHEGNESFSFDLGIRKEKHLLGDHDLLKG
jgi:pantoate--beta-alanine ligase